MKKTTKAKATPVRKRRAPNVCVTFPQYPHHLPNCGGIDGPRLDFEKVKSVFFALAHMVGVPMCAPQSRVSQPLVGDLANLGAVSFHRLYEQIRVSILQAYHQGQDDIRKAFKNMVAGTMPLGDFCAQMHIDPAETNARIIFSSAMKPPSARTPLCKAGTIDANGNLITPERLGAILKVYTENNVHVERVNDEIWFLGTEESKDG